MTRLLRWSRLAFADLRGDLRRFAVFIVYLALGTSVIAAVGSVGSSLQQAVEDNAAVLMGGDLEVSWAGRSAEPEELDYLNSLGAVAHVVDTNGHAKSGGNSALVDVLATGDTYPLAGSVVSPQLGPDADRTAFLAFRDGAFGALVDPLLLDWLELDIGGRFDISGTPFEIRGVVSSIPDAAARGFRLGVLTLISVEGFEGLGEYNPPLPGLVNRHRYKILLNELDFETAKRAVLEEFSDPVMTVRSPRDAAGNLVRYYDLFAHFLPIVGLASLLVGGVGISNSITAYINERRTSIAVLRSLGATKGRVLAHYLIQIGILTLIGVCLGILIGVLVSQLLLPLVGSALSVELRPHIDPAPLLVALGFGVLTGFGYCYVPLMRAQQVSPALLFRSVDPSGFSSDWRFILRPMIFIPIILVAAGIFALAVAASNDLVLVTFAALGVGLALVALRFSGIILKAGLKSLPPLRLRVIRHALRNIHGPGSTALVVVNVVGLGIAMLVIVVLLESNLYEQLTGAFRGNAPTFVATDLFDDEVEALETLTQDDPQITAFRWSPMLRGAVTAINGEPSEGMSGSTAQAEQLLSGEIPVTWLRGLPEGSEITDGEWWPEDYFGEPLVSLHASLQADLGLSVGDTMTIRLFGELIDAKITSFRDYDWLQGTDFLIALSPGDVEFYPSTYLGTIRAAGGREKDVERTLARTFPTVSFIPIGDALNRIAAVFGQLGLAVNLIGSLAVANGLFVLIGTMTAGHKKRRTDAIIQKALGATRAEILVAQIIETSLMFLFAALVAAGLGIGAAFVIAQRELDVAFSSHPGLIAAVILAALATATIPNAISTWRTLSAPSAPLLRSHHIRA